MWTKCGLKLDLNWATIGHNLDYNTWYTLFYLIIISSLTVLILQHSNLSFCCLYDIKRTTAKKKFKYNNENMSQMSLYIAKLQRKITKKKWQQF